jgi:hypothetical protein
MILKSKNVVIDFEKKNLRLTKFSSFTVPKRSPGDCKPTGVMDPHGCSMDKK